MSASSTPASALPWWKEPTKDQWYAYCAAWLGWTLDAFDFTVFLLIMRAAYDALDEETRASIEGLRVYHSIVYSRHVLGFDFNTDEQEKLKGAVHPLVRTIPGSGRRALYLASHAAHAALTSA